MTGSNPPRVPLALLRRYLSDNDPLVGDLLEGFALGRSRIWFWREAAAALVLHAFRRRDEEHPLGLAGPSGLAVPKAAMRVERRPVNLTASLVPGIGGLGLATLGTLVAVVNPRAMWIFVPAIVGGVALGVAFILGRRRGILAGRTMPRPILPHRPR
jgi:hypothetical protein